MWNKSYLRCLTQASDLSRLGIQHIPHLAPAQIYDSLVKVLTTGVRSNVMITFMADENDEDDDEGVEAQALEYETRALDDGDVASSSGIGSSRGRGAIGRGRIVGRGLGSRHHIQ